MYTMTDKQQTQLANHGKGTKWHHQVASPEQAVDLELAQQAAVPLPAPVASPLLAVV